MTEQKKTSTTKKVLWTLAGLFLLVVLVYIGLTAWSRVAVSNFNADAKSQMNRYVESKTETAETPVHLQTVPLASLINSKYKNVSNLQDNYKNLLADVENYVTTLTAYNSFIKQYNAEAKGLANAKNTSGGSYAKKLSKLADIYDVFARAIDASTSQSGCEPILDSAKMRQTATNLRNAATKVRNGNLNAADAAVSNGASIIQKYTNILSSERDKVDTDIRQFTSDVNK